MSDIENQDIDSLTFDVASQYFDPATFSIDPFVKIEPTEWGERAIFTPQGLSYVGSELRINEGAKIPDTLSDRFKIFIYVDGLVNIHMSDPTGNIITKKMDNNLGYRIHKGQRYSLEAVTKSRIIECSMSEPWTGEVHPDHFHYEEYVLRVGKPWGYELHFAKDDDPLMAKIHHMNLGNRFSLHAHRIRRESYWMLNGNCDIEMENKDKNLIRFPMEFGKGYTINVGQRHRHTATENCSFLEVGTRAGGRTWRIEDDYGRSDQTDELRKIEESTGNI